MFHDLEVDAIAVVEPRIDGNREVVSHVVGLAAFERGVPLLVQELKHVHGWRLGLD